jgi:DNA-directed RNA polymerase specialized sigma24 family protein
MTEAVIKDYKEKKEFLNSYVDVLITLEELKEELKDWEELSISKPKEGFYIENIIAKKDDIKNTQKLAEEKRILILSAIGETKDKRIRSVLRRRYILRQNMTEISEKIHYSLRHVKRLHKLGLEEIKLPEK